MKFRAQLIAVMFSATLWVPTAFSQSEEQQAQEKPKDDISSAVNPSKAKARFFRQRAAVDFAVAWMEKHHGRASVPPAG